MSEITHRKVHTNGIGMHIAEKGKGPLVLLIHGFPELWSSWIHQINCLAEHGYHVVAPDLRGYGDSDCPPAVASYTIFHLVGDLIGLLNELGEEKVFVVGHDWGAQIAWHLCLLRPDRVKALVNLGLPYRKRTPLKPTQLFAKAFGEGFYASQFQEPGRAEKSFSKYDCLTVLKKFLLINGPDLLAGPPGTEIIDFLETPSSLPPWIAEEELQARASKFEKSGFTGPLNYYRAMDMNWELLAAWDDAKINVPVRFIVGDKEVGFRAFGIKDHIEREEFKSCVPNMEVVLIESGHFIQEEKAEQVNNEILSFFSSHSLV